MLLQISEYAANGFRVFPLTSPTDSTLPKNQRGKKPLITAWQNSPLTPPQKITEKIFNLSHNFGVALDATDLVIDIDPRNGGLNSLRLLTKALSLDFLSLCTQTVFSGRDDTGRHLYFKKPANLRISKSLKDYPGIDFLTKGQFVVGCGSIHAYTLKPYTSSIDSLGFHQITEAPRALLNLIKKTTKPNDLKNQSGITEYADTTQNIERATKIIKNTAPAVEGNNGDDCTYKITTQCHDLGLSPETACDLLMEHYNPKCEPPWSLEEMELKVRNGYNYAQNPIGNKTAAADFDPKKSTKALDIQKQLEPIQKLTAEEAEVQTQEMISWEDGLICKPTKDGTLYPIPNSLKNTIMYLQNWPTLKDLFGFNIFTSTECLTRMPPWADKAGGAYNRADFDNHGFETRDIDGLLARVYLQNIGYETSMRIIEESISVVAECNAYHPVRDYLKTIKWDGTSRLDMWLTTYLGVEDSKYSRAIGRKTLIAAVARITDPGCKFDQVLILEGKQGAGKSTAIRNLVGDSWFSDGALNAANKDSVDQMQGVWLYELGEMECATKAETESFKAFITRPTDKVRKAYARKTQLFPRQCIFIGTTNRNDYLKDETGNRRYWPVICTKIDLEKIKQDRNQIWAEAYYRWTSEKESLFLPVELRQLAAMHQEHRMQQDDWTDIIKNYLDSGIPPSLQHDWELSDMDPIHKTSSLEIWKNCFGQKEVDLDRRTQVRIKRIMDILGWSRSTVRLSGKIVGGYKRPAKTDILGDSWKDVISS